MDWIKRNLYFLIGGVVALALMGLAGYFLYSKWQQNNLAMEQLNADYDQLRQFYSQNPHPGAGDVNNIELAKKQTAEVRGLIKKVREDFKPISPIPDQSELSDRDFSGALARTLEQLRQDATNASVTLPLSGTNYYFSFAAQNARFTYAAGSLGPLATQLGEVKAICDVLFKARVNSLDGIRREKISADDQTGTQTDYLEKKSTTNELAVLSPYEVVFRCFSPELAAVLEGFASSPHGLNVKAINVELAPAAMQPELQYQQPVYYTTPIATPTYSGADEAPGAAEARFRNRYGIGPGGGRGRYGPGTPGLQPQPQLQPQTVYVTQPTTATASKGGLQTVIDEKQLKVTLVVYVVKLLPAQGGAK